MYKVILLIIGMLIAMLAAKEEDIKIKIALYLCAMLTWGHIILLEVIC